MPTKSKNQDQTFLFTGTLTEFTRDEAEALVEANGGKVLSDVTAKLNYLVVGADAGSKLEKAKAIKTVRIISEKEFLKMVPKGNAPAKKPAVVKPKKAVAANKEKVKASAKPVASKSDAKKISGGDAFEEVQIGKQIWMAKNLDVTHFRNGEEIKRALSLEEFEDYGNDKLPAYIIYKNKDSNRKKFGLLYNFYAVKSVNMLAPLGYRIPNTDDWNELRLNFNSNAEFKEAMVSRAGYSKIGLKVLFGGGTFFEQFVGLNKATAFWTCSEWDDNKPKTQAKAAFYETFGSSIGLTDRNTRHFSCGFSVRCIKECSEKGKTTVKQTAANHSTDKIHVNKTGKTKVKILSKKDVNRNEVILNCDIKKFEKLIIKFRGKLKTKGSINLTKEEKGPISDVYFESGGPDFIYSRADKKLFINNSFLGDVGDRCPFLSSNETEEFFLGLAKLSDDDFKIDIWNMESKRIHWCKYSNGELLYAFDDEDRWYFDFDSYEYFLSIAKNKELKKIKDEYGNKDYDNEEKYNIIYDFIDELLAGRGATLIAPDWYS
jgi:uncharacterized protein (TIGR02145 family)